MPGVPNGLLIPIFSMDFEPDRSQIGGGVLPHAFLIIGQKTAAGTLPAETMKQVFNANEVLVDAGVGSMAHAMSIDYFDNNRFTDCYIILLDDAATSTAATRTITFAGPATENGEIAIYINGTRVVVAVADEDDATDMGDTFVAKLSDFPELPWTGVNAAGVVTMTCKNKGIAAGDNDMRHSLNAGEAPPAGTSVTIGATTPGMVDPDVQDALDAIGDKWITALANPYSDTTNMDAIETYLEARFLPLDQKDGYCYQCKRGTVSELVTFATNASRNSKMMNLLDAEKYKTSIYQLAAAWGGACIGSIQFDAGQPLHRLEVKGILPNELSERRTPTERQTLANNGVCSLVHDPGVYTNTTVTMYLKNSAAVRDTSYQFQNTLYILQAARYDFNTALALKYPRARLALSADRVRPGIQIITPSIARDEAISWFIRMEKAGLFDGGYFDDFKRDLVVAKDETEKNRLNWLLPPKLIEQLIVSNAITQFS